MRKRYKIIILLIIMYVLMSPGIAVDNKPIKDPIIYRVFIDQYYGFYRVFEENDKLLGDEIDSGFDTSNKTLNATLNISRGDTVIWTNDAVPNKKMTIVSKEKLWNISKEKVFDRENGTLNSNGKEFSYTFNKSGIYNVYVKERPILKQKIIVGPLDPNATNVAGTDKTRSNTNGTKPSQTTVTKTQNSTNTTGSNLTTKSSQNNTTAIRQNSTTNKSGTVPISISLAGGLFSKMKSKSDVSIMITILLGIYILSGRIKEN